MSRVAPWHQTNWDWRAALNFIGGGSGTGLLVLAAVAALDGLPYRPAAILALILIAAGLTFVWLEIGRPWRAINVFFHPQTSWMTRESFVAMPLFAAGLAALWLEDLAIVWAAALLALLFLYCQGRILHASKGIPAWRHPALMPVIFVTGLTEGAGLVTALAPIIDEPKVWQGAVLMVLLIARFGLWVSYRQALAATGAPMKALAVLDRLNAPLLWAGHVLPAALFAAGVFVADAAAPLAVAAGLTAAAGGWALKFVVIARAAYNQGFALNRLPVRGRGTPPPGAKPGWS